MSEKEALRRRIYAVEFASWELHLFLDTHPNNSEASKKLDECRERARMLRKEYEEKFGPIGETPQNTSRWAWISDPWPWEKEAN
ncbi:spore coat protein CotJB [uncultured Neglectibacter sp.]|mgnify:CR=1 FL=1|uniref:spore coat protein CotJB n=1 Tax=uncultured Neglectibacter sp. TaxID=1924108 RepID=UPI0034E00A1E